MILKYNLSIESYFYECLSYMFLYLLLHTFTTLRKKLHSIDHGVYSLHATMTTCFQSSSHKWLAIDIILAIFKILG